MTGLHSSIPRRRSVRASSRVTPQRSVERIAWRAKRTCAWESSLHSWTSEWVKDITASLILNKAIVSVVEVDILRFLIFYCTLCVTHYPRPSQLETLYSRLLFARPMMMLMMMMKLFNGGIQHDKSIHLIIRYWNDFHPETSSIMFLYVFRVYLMPKRHFLCRISHSGFE